MASVEPRSRKRSDVMMIGLRSVGQGQGGVEAHVEQLSEELDRAGYAVEIIARTPYAGREVVTQSRNIRIVPIWSPRGRSTEAVVHSLLGVLYAAFKRPRLVHIHAIGPSLMIPVARAFGLRVVFTHHGEDYNREKWGRAAKFALKLGEYFGATLAHARICVSPSLARSLTSKYNATFRYIPNGVRKVSPVTSSNILDTLGLVRGYYILHVGRIVPEKRQVDLIQALAILNLPKLKLVLVGAADHQSEYSRQIDALASEYPNVVLAGFRSGLELAELYSNAGIFALPSSHEGLPIALLEALSYGCRVIASDIEANLNLSLPSKCYFPAASVESLAAGIEGILAEEDFGGPIDWTEYLVNFDWTEIAKKTIAIYEGIVRFNGADVEDTYNLSRS